VVAYSRALSAHASVIVNCNRVAKFFLKGNKKNLKKKLKNRLHHKVLFQHNYIMDGKTNQTSHL